MSGNRYFVLIRDEYSTYPSVYFVSSKMHISAKLKEFVLQVSAQTQKKVGTLRTDNGTEFKNTAMKLICQAEGIIQEFSSFQHARAE